MTRTRGEAFAAALVYAAVLAGPLAAGRAGAQSASTAADESWAPELYLT